MEIWTLKNVSCHAALTLCFIFEGVMDSNPGNIPPITQSPTSLCIEGGPHSVFLSQVELVKYEEGTGSLTYLFK